MGFLDAVSAERILVLLEQLGFELFANELLHEDSAGELVVLKGLEEFREHLGGQLTITLLQGVGRGFEVHEMDSTVVLTAIRELHSRHQQRALTISARA
jgi:3-dehydroquinate synthase